MTPERKYKSPRKPVEILTPSAQIARIGGAYHVAYPRDTVIFAGWTSDGKVTIGSGEQCLTPDALESLHAYQASKLKIRKTDLTNITPVEFSFVGNANDIKDSSHEIAQDVIQIGVKGPDGKSIVLPIGELDILKGIFDADKPWQESPRGVSIGEPITESRLMYSVLVPHPRDSRQTLAILFAPAIAGSSNESKFQVFARNVFSKLLIIDESQASARQKGYVKAAAQFVGEETVGEYLDVIILRKTLKFLSLLGLIDIDEDGAGTTTSSEYYYDLDQLDKLDIHVVFSLAQAMYTSADRYING